MKTTHLVMLGIGALVLYEYLKANNPSILSSLGLGNLPYPGLGRVYLSGMGTIGQGYNINETFAGDASHYEMAQKFVM